MKNLLLILFVSLIVSARAQSSTESTGVVTIKGVAIMEKSGAVIYDKNNLSYEIGNNYSWTDNQLGRKVKVTGELFHVKNDGEVIIDGTVVTGLQKKPYFKRIVPSKIKVISKKKIKFYEGSVE